MRFFVRNTIWCLAFLSGLLAFLLPGNAAEIVKYRNDHYGCTLKIDGVIQKGDADKFVALINHLSRTDDYYLSLDRSGSRNLPWTDETAKARERHHRICLNSKGGSYVEALKMVDIITDQFGTVVERGNHCESACAILFMAGSFASEADVGTIPDRYLHALGKLGFHAPDLLVPEGDYARDTVSKAYRLAISAISSLHAKSSQLRFGRDLFQAFLKTSPEDMFYIQTTGQAAIWKIDIVGTVYPANLSAIEASRACQNLSMYMDQFGDVIGSGVTKEPYYLNPDLASWPKKRPYFPTVKSAKQQNGDVSYELEGYRQEGASTCSFNFKTKSIDLMPRALGLNGSASMDGGGYGSWLGLLPYHLFPFDTALESIAASRDGIVEYREMPHIAVTENSKAKGTCRVVSRGRLTDEEPCERHRYSFVDQKLQEEATSSYEWPSGNKTVVSQKPHNAGIQINGSPAGWPEDNLKPSILKSWYDWGDCTLNKRSGNVFCFQGVL